MSTTEFGYFMKKGGGLTFSSGEALGTCGLTILNP